MGGDLPLHPARPHKHPIKSAKRLPRYRARSSHPRSSAPPVMTSSSALRSGCHRGERRRRPDLRHGRRRRSSRAATVKTRSMEASTVTTSPANPSGTQSSATTTNCRAGQAMTLSKATAAVTSSWARTAMMTCSATTAATTCAAAPTTTISTAEPARTPVMVASASTASSAAEGQRRRADHSGCAPPTAYPLGSGFDIVESPGANPFPGQAERRPVEVAAVAGRVYRTNGVTGLTARMGRKGHDDRDTGGRGLPRHGDEYTPAASSVWAHPRSPCWATWSPCPPAGYADVVGIEEDGRPVIIEVKLRNNAESRRAVIAQTLSYAASMHRSTQPKLKAVVLGRHLNGQSIIDRVRETLQDEEMTQSEFEKKKNPPRSRIVSRCHRPGGGPRRTDQPGRIPLVRKRARPGHTPTRLHVDRGGVERAVQLWSATSGVSRNLDTVTARGDLEGGANLVLVLATMRSRQQ